MGSKQLYKFDTQILKLPGRTGAFVEIPFDVKATFGKSRVLVSATFDDVPQEGQLVQEGAAHFLSIRQDSRRAIDKQTGDSVRVTLEERTAAPKNAGTVDDYIAAYDGEARARMETLRTLILSCDPNIQEKISWDMPAFVLNGPLVYFAAAKKHLGFYPMPKAIEAYSDQLAPYKHSKGAIQFPYDKPMPYDLIREMVLFRIKANTQDSPPISI